VAQRSTLSIWLPKWLDTHSVWYQLHLSEKGNDPGPTIQHLATQNHGQRLFFLFGLKINTDEKGWFTCRVFPQFGQSFVQWTTPRRSQTQPVYFVFFLEWHSPSFLWLKFVPEVTHFEDYQLFFYPQCVTVTPFVLCMITLDACPNPWKKFFSSTAPTALKSMEIE